MPKLDATHILSRLNARLEQLVKGEEVARRELESLLTEHQIAAWDAAWEQQQQLRKQKRARTKEEEAALGWKSKREVTIEVLKAAIEDAWNGLEAEMERLQRKAEVRATKIYFNNLKQALDEGRSMQEAEVRANNALTRAGLRRMDGRVVGTLGLNKRDREIREMEDAILRKAESELSEEEREQLELVREHDKAVAERWKKRGW